MLGGGWWGGEWFFTDYRVPLNLLEVLGLRLWLRLGFGCDNLNSFGHPRTI